MACPTCMQKARWFTCVLPQNLYIPVNTRSTPDHCSWLDWKPKGSERQITCRRLPPNNDSTWTSRAGLTKSTPLQITVRSNTLPEAPVALLQRLVELELGIHGTCRAFTSQPPSPSQKTTEFHISARKLVSCFWDCEPFQSRCEKQQCKK